MTMWERTTTYTEKYTQARSTRTANSFDRSEPDESSNKTKFSENS